MVENLHCRRCWPGIPCCVLTTASMSLFSQESHFLCAYFSSSRLLPFLFIQDEGKACSEEFLVGFLHPRNGDHDATILDILLLPNKLQQKCAIACPFPFMLRGRGSWELVRYFECKLLHDFIPDMYLSFLFQSMPT